MLYQLSTTYILEISKKMVASDIRAKVRLPHAIDAYFISEENTTCSYQSNYFRNKIQITGVVPE
jgi:hypothetical protein